MQQLADSLAESQHPGETSLRQKLTDTIIPALIETAPARKRMEDKAYAMEAAPRKRSSRLQVHSDFLLAQPPLRLNNAPALHQSSMASAPMHLCCCRS